MAPLMLLSACISSGEATGTPTLNWGAPLTRVDGSKLYPGEIDGYRVYYRQDEESVFRSHRIDSPNETTWTPTTLESGTYTFAVSTVDTTGLESPRSETLRITIP